MNVQLKRGDIVYADLGVGLGSEQSGIRPVLIIQNDIGNKYSGTTIVASITSSGIKHKTPTHVELPIECGMYKDSIVLLEQIRAIDKTRIRYKCFTLSKEYMKKVDSAIRISINV